MKLCASAAFWLPAYPSQEHEMLFDAHTRSFTTLGDAARHLRQHENGGAQGQEEQGPRGECRFAAMFAHHLFDPGLCNTAGDSEKGRAFSSG